jgi:voltage-dependent potassium channel beta subunit
MTDMTYRHLGRSGLKVSVLSFGSWVSFGGQMDIDKAEACMVEAHDAGVNFFDNAEAYAAGKSEEIMGEVIKRQGWPRHSYVISSKYFWGMHGPDAINAHHTLNRKYLMEAIDPSLERLQLDHLDLIYCHRADPDTPIEETVFAMSEIVSSGRAHYWGTSEWTADEIRAAYEIAERHSLHKPVVEQPQYNMFERDKVENEFARLYEDIGLGLTTFSPLASGLLTGKYLDGIPDDSRAALDGYEWLRDQLTDPERNSVVANLAELADELGCTLAQLALGWCASNPNVSSVITGASRPDQVTENMKALDVLSQLDEDDDLLTRIEDILSGGD